MIIPKIFRGALLLYFLQCTVSVQAQTLSELFDQALAQEPNYLGSRANVSAAVEKSKQAVSGLFPQITASFSTNRYTRDYVTRDSTIPPASDQYNNNTQQLNYTQPVWRRANILAVSQAHAVVQQTQQQLIGTEQELGSKLVSAWCEVLQARDHQLLTEKQSQATHEQWKILKRGVEIGTHAEPSLAEARAKYDQALSDQETARTDIEIKMAALEQLTGTLIHFTPPILSPQFDPKTLQPEPLEYWNEQAEHHNPALLAAQHALVAAHEEIRKQQAGHEPTVDMVITYSSNNQNAGNFPGQNGYHINQKSLGLQMNVPLFSGGGQIAKVAEAVAMEEKAWHDIEIARRTAHLNLKQAWFGWKAGYSRYTASLQSIQSALLALKAAQKGIQTGTKTLLDQLQAQQQLATAK